MVFYGILSFFLLLSGLAIVSMFAYLFSNYRSYRFKAAVRNKRIIDQSLNMKMIEEHNVEDYTNKMRRK